MVNPSPEADSASHKNTAVPAKLIFTNPIMFLAFGAGTGLAPKAPGTAGTLVGIPIAVMLSLLPFWVELAIILFMLMAGIYICDYAANKLGVHDHGGIVWDEIVGFALTVLLVPKTGFWLLLGFVAFRFFDIVKPWPIRELDHRIPGGFGIMLDDVIAAVFAAITLVAIGWGMTLM